MYKPLFILVTVFAVMASRYCAVFPIAKMINAVTSQQLPREYQIMLFWAGLRGAVGFALSAGIEGQNAIALQTTVLVTVVLTVIVFGGTTAQMLHVLAIRTGVQDDEVDSDDEGPGGAELDSPRSSTDVLPPSGTGRVVFRDGKWFQQIDQQYLLPMFSNSVASRKHEDRLSRANGNGNGNGGGSGSGSGNGTHRRSSQDMYNEADADVPDEEDEEDLLAFTPQSSTRSR